MNRAPLLKAAGLWKKTSASGNEYFVGRWGGVKILILENRDRQSETEPTHNLLISEAADRSRAAAPETQQPNHTAGKPVQRRRAPHKAVHRDRPADDPRPFDDEIPL